MKEPFLYKDKEPINWSFAQVAELVQDVTDLGCLKELLAEADRAGVVVQVPPEAINFVKRFLFRNGHHKTSKKAANVIASAGCIPTPQPPNGGPPVFPPPGPGDPPPF